MTLLFALACTDPTPASSDTPTETDVPTVQETDEPVSTADTAEPPPPTPPPPYRPTQAVCDELPELPTTFSGLPAFGPHEDFAFDAEGYLTGVAGNSNLTRRNR